MDDIHNLPVLREPGGGGIGNRARSAYPRISINYTSIKIKIKNKKKNIHSATSDHSWRPSFAVPCAAVQGGRAFC